MEGRLELSMFANLSKLYYLDLASDHGLEIDTESPSWIPSFQLNVLVLNGCTVNKHRGYQIPSFLSTQSHLIELYLQSSSLAGRLPPWMFCNSSLSLLNLGNNSLHGRFPQPCHNSSSSINEVFISYNRISGSLPKNFGFLFPRLEALFMKSNRLEGQLPPSLGLMSLQMLDLSENSLSGELPLELTRNATTLRWVDLSNNKLQGEMLPSGSHLPFLQFLYIRGNRFTGPISQDVSNSSSLLILDVRENNMGCDLSLSGCLPILGGGVSGLLLSGNFFRGQLPRSLCRMPNLQFLDISANKLSGEIPPCLNNISLWKSSMHHGISRTYFLGSRTVGNFYFPMTVVVTVDFTSKYNVRTYRGGPLSLMTGLDLSSNMLEGSIPPELGELKQLQTLNLSNNHLLGSIPASLCNLVSIESLDFSRNSLNGTIPHELAALHFLEIFSVAFNNLSGRIPFDGQFSSFNTSSYEGNAGLCGAPLEQRCSVDSTNQTDEEEHRGGREDYGVLDNDALFYIFLACSYLLGLWCFMAILLLKKQWRFKFFRAVDRFYDKYILK